MVINFESSTGVFNVMNKFTFNCFINNADITIWVFS